ncbi:MAG: hypothetical protein IJJ68_06475 [Prevotella sp.]|nr:hypothetical protein [Prevotella sp.]
MTFNKTIARLLPPTWMLAVLACFTACSGSDEAVTETPVTPSNNSKNVAVTFNTYVQSGNTQTRATYPSEAASGSIDINRLKSTGFGVFTQHTSNTEWASYTDKSTTPFNFMWNQQVTWDGTSAWTYSPVKYWPNDNNPADNAGATGSQEHSYLSFFAYAPYAPVATPASGFDVKDVDENSDGKPDHDGIVAVSLNNANANASYLYYRTSLEKPFGIDKSVDLLWTNQRDLYKMKESGEGNVDGRVSLNFKHALTKLDINVRAMVDNTASASSPAYSTEVDGNTRIYIDNVSITTPTYYPEGKLKITSDNDTPVWDYSDISTSKTLFRFGSDIDLSLANVNNSKDLDNVKYSLRYAAPNIPTNASIDDSDGDGIDDNTGLTLVETARETFNEEMEAGVIKTEQQLAANYSTFMFCPSTAESAISVTAVYHVVTFDPNLTLNNPKFYSNVTNNITATLGNTVKFEPNKQYKILLNLGITSVKFEVSVLDENGEWILLSAVVKEWDLITKEVDVK